ncbi:glycosyltransferase [Sulfurovum sp. ST-21]|uniref:Glycosyltransferase n=1 Tax=Sulfurovum indicum TaxID=2779528 RepID=A0A7M1S7C5_9BACT|nr:glycosyltransferase [Sulfurovum indicum]QOR62619.1 glycosyltransferase [Sulfurovum indicum]
MNILHLSSYDDGGAGYAAYKVHKHLKDAGHNTLFCVERKTIKDDAIIEIRPSLLHKLKRKIFRFFEDKLLDSSYSFIDRGHYSLNSIEKFKKNVAMKPDVIVIYWVSRFINMKFIYKLHKEYNVPIFWYFLDMAPMTGGCHYALECQGYFHNCKNCKAIKSKYWKLSEKNWKHKKKYIDKSKIVGMTISSWTKKQAKQSSLFKDVPIERLIIDVDENIFQPINKTALRKKYNLSADKKIILFGAMNFNDYRKGMNFLFDAFQQLKKSSKVNIEEIILVSIGNINNIDISRISGFEHVNLGYLNGEEKLAEAYQLADIFVSPSIDDSGPMMINEAIMCGTPVVAFKTGVACDLVINNKTGYLAEIKNIDDFCDGMAALLNMNKVQYDEMSRSCRMLGLELYSSKKQLDKILAIFHKYSYDFKGEGVHSG